MRNQGEFVQLLDRHRLGLSQRLAIGLHVGPSFEHIEGALLLAEGRGKFLKPQWVEFLSFPIPDSLRSSCLAIAHDPKELGAEFLQLRVDFTRSLASAAARLATRSGSAANRLLAICVSDPGVWPLDYDGQPSFASFCESNHLAELTGLTIVDSLPQRDLAGQGRGTPFEPLPFWLLFADRNKRISEQTRILLHLAEEYQLFYLPESDGLDNELPPIQYRRLPGLGLRQALTNRFDRPATASQTAETQSKNPPSLIVPLVRAWQDLLEQSSTALRNSPPFQTPDFDEAFLELVKPHASDADKILSTFDGFLAQETKRFCQRVGTSSAREFAVIESGQLGATAPLQQAVLDALQSLDSKSLAAPLTFDEIGLVAPAHHAAATAMLGLMHLDQMPAGLPWLTGAHQPRVLGRLTPGGPSNWRQVIMEMADYHPPVMKLRDAI